MLLIVLSCALSFTLGAVEGRDVDNDILSCNRPEGKLARNTVCVVNTKEKKRILNRKENGNILFYFRSF